MPDFEAAFLQTVEDAAVNASAPPEQLWLDGWLIRLGREKAKRARCIHALALGQSSLADRIRRAEALYEAAGLPVCARLTPFSRPAGLDADLAALGWRSFGASQVMVCARLRERQKPEGATDCRLRRAEPAEFAQTLGNFQGADTPQREAHAERLLRSTVTHEARVAVDDPGTVVACGEVAIEGALAGLYGVHTANGWRGRGVGAALCAALLDLASERGASAAYLQVEANNAAAHRLYARFGFVDAYRYHYRSPPEAA